tara:strand:- start:50 stop:616 length:567 start_codon:yes stop_codon:yes gene_type:complete
METNKSDKQIELLNKIAFNYFQPWGRTWGNNYNDMPENINYNYLKGIVDDLNGDEKTVFNSLRINNMQLICKDFLIKLNNDTIGYIEDFMQIDLIILYNIFKTIWLKEIIKTIKKSYVDLTIQINDLNFRSRDYEITNSSIKQKKRDWKKFAMLMLIHKNPILRRQWRDKNKKSILYDHLTPTPNTIQ